MADEKSPNEIEREIEIERAQLASSLDQLTEKFSVDNMVRTVSDQVTEHGGEAATNLMRTVKGNPVAAILAGAGIAWLMVSSNQPRERVLAAPGATRRPGMEPGPYVDSDYRRSQFGRTPDPALDDLDDLDDMDDLRVPGGNDAVTPAPAYDRSGGPTARGFADTYPAGDFTSRVAAADRGMHAGEASAEDWSYDDDDGGRRREGFFDRMGHRLEALEDRAEGIWGQAMRTIRGGAQGVAARATDLRDSIMEGTEGMDDYGRSRVAQARARAYSAQARAEAMGRNARAGASNFFYEQPLVTGALAVAAGAAIGAMLPRTQREDEAFGSYRDSLFEEAEHIYEQERARAESAATAALREAKQVAIEAKDKVMQGADGEETVQKAEAGARSAVERVSDAAREGANKAST